MKSKQSKRRIVGRLRPLKRKVRRRPVLNVPTPAPYTDDESLFVRPLTPAEKRALRDALARISAAPDEATSLLELPTFGQAEEHENDAPPCPL